MFYSVFCTFFSLIFLPELRRVRTGEMVPSDPAPNASSLLIFPEETRSHISIYKNKEVHLSTILLRSTRVGRARTYAIGELGMKFGGNFPEATNISVKKFLSKMLLAFDVFFFVNLDQRATIESKTRA